MYKVKKEFCDEVASLNARLIYLNELRVGVGKFYIVVVGAILTALTLKDANNILFVFKFLGLPILVMGFSTYIFDLKTRARAGAVARGIKERVEYAEPGPKDTIEPKFEEDLFFNIIIQTLNSTVIVAYLASVYYDSTTELITTITRTKIVIAIAIFLLTLIGQTLFWRSYSNSLSKSLPEWPV